MQIAEMQRQMADLPPGFIEQQMQAMNSMNPEVLQQRMAEADQLDPMAAEAQLKEAVSRARQHEEYQVVDQILSLSVQALHSSPGFLLMRICLCIAQVRVSNQLKEEGNRLYKAQDYRSALEKYSRAKSNLTGVLKVLLDVLYFVGP